MAAKKPSPPAPKEWSTYKQLLGLVLGFHGCDKNVAELVLRGKTPHLAKSNNGHDWLGPGIYFWEADPWRALAWAREAKKNPAKTSKPVKTPYVIGAVIDLGRCCNLMDFDTLNEVEKAHSFISNLYAVTDLPFPANELGPDRVKRYRDKLVMDSVHSIRETEGLPSYQTVRAAFLEGPPLYEGAGFRRRNHIQIAVLDSHCIKGYFRLPGL